MRFEPITAFDRLAGFFADPFLLTEVGASALSGFLFLCTLVAAALAYRAAAAAHRARSEAQDLAVEVRRLTAQIEAATARRAAIPDSEGADGAIDLAAEERTRTPAVADDASHGDPTLETAARSATVPSALLGRFRRRRE